MSTATPQERVRASILLTVLPIIAERLLQVDKANPAYKLSDLRDDDERAIYFADAEELMSPERRCERGHRLNSLRAHGFALAEKDDRELEAMARADVRRYGSERQHFGRVPENVCLACLEPTILNKVTVWIGVGLKADAHGLCCAKDDMRFDFVNEGTYQFKGEQL